MGYSDFVPLFKALADDKRLKIIDMLSQEPLCACKILEQFNFSQPALSQHMKVLVDCGLVSAVRKGNWMHYFLVREKFKQTSQFILDIANEDKTCSKEEGEACR